jgi:phosphohistidine phosphatase SixA
MQHGMGQQTDHQAPERAANAQPLDVGRCSQKGDQRRLAGTGIGQGGCQTAAQGAQQASPASVVVNAAGRAMKTAASVTPNTPTRQ